MINTQVDRIVSGYYDIVEERENIISHRIKRVSERMKLIASGDLSNEPLETRAEDEVRQLVKEVHVTI